MIAVLTEYYFSVKLSFISYSFAFFSFSFFFLHFCFRETRVLVCMSGNFIIIIIITSVIRYTGKVSQKGSGFYKWRRLLSTFWETFATVHSRCSVGETDATCLSLYLSFSKGCLWFSCTGCMLPSLDIFILVLYKREGRET